MARDVLVLVEHSDGKVESLTCQLLAIGSRLAKEMQVDLVAAAIGHRMDNVVQALQGNGIDRILVVDDPGLALAGGEVQAHLFAEIARDVEPHLVLIGYSLVGMELAPAVASKLGMNALTNCVNIEFRDGAVTVTRPLFDVIDRILVVDDPGLALAGGEVQAHLFAEIARDVEPHLVLIGYSLVGMELAPAVASKLGMNALTNCVNIEFRDGAVTVTRPLFD